MSRLTRDGTDELVSRDQILRRERGQGNVHVPCSADHEQDWQPYPVDPCCAICDDHTYIHIYIHHGDSPLLKPNRDKMLARSKQPRTSEADPRQDDVFGFELQFLLSRVCQDFRI